MHIIQSVHTEMECMKEEWEAAVSKPAPPKPSRQTSIEPALAEAVGKSSDTYCYELLSMLIGLSQSDMGCAFLAEQEKLVQDLFTMLHTATTRIQLQVRVCVGVGGGGKGRREGEGGGVHVYVYLGVGERFFQVISGRTRCNFVLLPSADLLPSSLHPTSDWSQEPRTHVEHPHSAPPWLQRHR